MNNSTLEENFSLQSSIQYSKLQTYCGSRQTALSKTAVCKLTKHTLASKTTLFSKTIVLHQNCYKQTLNSDNNLCWNITLQLSTTSCSKRFWKRHMIHRPQNSLDTWNTSKEHWSPCHKNDQGTINLAPPILSMLKLKLACNTQMQMRDIIIPTNSTILAKKQGENIGFSHCIDKVMFGPC